MYAPNAVKTISRISKINFVPETPATFPRNYVPETPVTVPDTPENETPRSVPYTLENENTKTIRRYLTLIPESPLNNPPKKNKKPLPDLIPITSQINSPLHSSSPMNVQQSKYISISSDESTMEGWIREIPCSNSES